MTYTAVILCLLYGTLFAQNTPPSITMQPPPTIYYRTGEAVNIPCKAKGVPNPEYQWTKNKVKFDLRNDDSILQLPDEGTILIDGPNDKDEGVYQCNATNSLGTSITENVILRMAKLEVFPKGKDRSMTSPRGHSIKLNCFPPISVPEAEIKWALKTKQGKMKAIELNNRITQDLEGNLYITTVREEDRQGGMKYVCMAINYFMRTSIVGPGTEIIPTGSKEEMLPPYLLWSSPVEVVGFLDESLRIKCIYGGNPTPVVNWKSTTGTFPDNRRTLSSGGQELLIYTLIASDTGRYTCYTTGLNGRTEQRTIHVFVKTRLSWTEKPKDIDAKVGTTATFRCVAGGSPPAPVYQWFINGVRMEESKHPTKNSNRFYMRNMNEVQISDVIKSDSMVIQCNASNPFGYVFGNAYLNVL